MNKQIVLLANNLRSSHNVGALFRTAECLGVNKLYLCGFTPHPNKKNDDRLPHIVARNKYQISKTALGAEDHLAWEYHQKISEAISKLKNLGFRLVALEQAKDSVKLGSYLPRDKTALVVGNEPNGIEQTTLDMCDDIIEIPMQGKKESLNVVQAAAIALFVLQEA